MYKVTNEMTFLVNIEIIIKGYNFRIDLREG